MLPANLAKGRAAAAARGLGEYLMVGGAGPGPRYAPFAALEVSSGPDTPQPTPPHSNSQLAGGAAAGSAPQDAAATGADREQARPPKRRAIGVPWQGIVDLPPLPQDQTSRAWRYALE